LTYFGKSYSEAKMHKLGQTPVRKGMGCSFSGHYCLIKGRKKWGSLYLREYKPSRNDRRVNVGTHMMRIILPPEGKTPLQMKRKSF